MKTDIVIYIIILNKETLGYDILSEHPDRYVECSAPINFNTDLDSQVEELYQKYVELHSDYIKFIHLKPYIENNILKIPFYCLVPYNSYNIKNSYKLSCKEYAKFIPNIRKILNIL